MDEPVEVLVSIYIYMLDLYVGVNIYIYIYLYIYIKRHDHDVVYCMVTVRGAPITRPTITLLVPVVVTGQE